LIEARLQRQRLGRRVAHLAVGGDLAAALHQALVQVLEARRRYEMGGAQLGGRPPLVGGRLHQALDVVADRFVGKLHGWLAWGPWAGAAGRPRIL